MSNFLKKTFCHNPKCHFHIQVPIENIRAGYMNVKTHAGQKVVRRHKYEFELNPPVYYCDVCHNAVSIIDLNKRFNLTASICDPH